MRKSFDNLQKDGEMDTSVCASYKYLNGLYFGAARGGCAPRDPGVQHACDSAKAR